MGQVVALNNQVLSSINIGNIYGNKTIQFKGPKNNRLKDLIDPDQIESRVKNGSFNIYDKNFKILTTIFANAGEFKNSSGTANVDDFTLPIDSIIVLQGLNDVGTNITLKGIFVEKEESKSLMLEPHKSYFLKVKQSNQEILMNVLNASQLYRSTKIPKKLEYLENFSTYFLKGAGYTLNNIFYKTDFSVGDEIKIQNSSNGQINSYIACGINCQNGWYNYNNETLNYGDKITIITTNSNKKYFKIKNIGNITIEKCETFIQTENFYKILNSKTISSIFNSNDFDPGAAITFYTQGKLNGENASYYPINGNWLNPNGQMDNNFLIPEGSLLIINSIINKITNIKSTSTAIIQKYINKIYSYTKNPSQDFIYIYKGGLSNKLKDILNPNSLVSGIDTIKIAGRTYIAAGSNWINSINENISNNVVLQYGDEIVLNTNNIIDNLDVNGGAILSKTSEENFNGKIRVYFSENDLLKDNANFQDFICDNLYWFNQSGDILKYDYIIPDGGIIVFDCNYLNQLNFSSSAKIKKYNKLIINKKNLTTLKSLSFDSDAIYRFKSARNNTLAEIFDPKSFRDYDSLFIFYEGSLDGPYDVFFILDSNWGDVTFSFITNNYIIPTNSILVFSTSQNINIQINGGASIVKHNSGKLNTSTTHKNLTKYLSNNIDSLISNLTASNNTLKLFTTEQPNGICCQGDNSTDPVNPVYIRNTNCWAKNIDTSPISIWNNGGGYSAPEHAGGSGGAGILITRKHVLLAYHFHIKPGKKLIFVDMNNNTYVRTLLSVERLPSNNDILIGVLDSDLPSSVSNVKILDPNTANKLSNILTNDNRIPVFVMDVSRKAYVAELFYNNSNFVISDNPTNLSKRKEFYPYHPETFGYALSYGDSGNTCSIVYNNKLVHIFHFLNPNDGPNAFEYINLINQAIQNLENSSGYTVETESLGL